MKLLEIQSSPRGASSDSISLTKSFIEVCRADNTSIVVDTLSVWHERLRNIGFTGLAIFRPGIIVGNAHAPAWVGWMPRAWAVWQYRSADSGSLNRQGNISAQPRDW